MPWIWSFCAELTGLVEVELDAELEEPVLGDAPGGIAAAVEGPVLAEVPATDEPVAAADDPEAAVEEPD